MHGVAAAEAAAGGFHETGLSKRPDWYGEALRKCVKNICVAKMRTNAFLTTIGQ